jgi:hypothetical protein
MVKSIRARRVTTWIGRADGTRARDLRRDRPQVYPPERPPFATAIFPFTWMAGPLSPALPWGFFGT